MNDVHVAFVGSGRPVDLSSECELGYRPILFSCVNQFNNMELVN
jgi:hypothetical protein